MPNIKNFGLAGIGQTVQIGKQGGHIKYTTTAPDGSGSQAPAFQFRDVLDSTNMRIQAGAPIAPDDVTTKLYVDGLVQGLNIKEAVQLATNGQDVPLTGTTPFEIDGVAIANGDRLLLKDQTDPTSNGIYVAEVSGGAYTLTRAKDADNSNSAGQSTEVTGGLFVFVTNGTTQSDTGWVLSSPNGLVTLGTDPIEFTQFSSAGATEAGIGIDKDGNTLNVLFDNSTIYVDGSNNLSVKSSTTTGQILVSQGGGAALWSSLDLANAGTVGTSILPVANGGTGHNQYVLGDMLVADSATTFRKLAKGANYTILTVDETGTITYDYMGTLRDSTGQLILQGLGVATAANYLTASNSTAGTSVTIGADGTDVDINLELAPKGNGVVTAKAGYDAWFQTNQESISAEALVTKGFVDSRVDAIDTSVITSADGSTFVATERAGWEGKAIIGSYNKVLAEFESSNLAGIAENGERLRITHDTNEVQLKAVNTTGVGDVDIRLVPQQQGHVFFGETGAGMVQSELGFQLTVKGGDNSSTADAGDLVLRGGDSTEGNFNGGNVRIRGGLNAGTGTRGTVIIEDDRQVPIVEFKSPTTPATNWLEISNSSTDVDNFINGVKVDVAAASASADVDIYFNPKGVGLLRVADAATYLQELQTEGQDDALVTKGFLSDTVGGTNKTAGVGLSDDNNVFNVNVNAGTITVDGTNNLIVNSSTTVNQVLLSAGVSGTQPTWGPLPLTDSNAVTGALPATNGGTGISSFTANDILVGAGDGTLTKLAKGANYSVLTVGADGNLSYAYPSILRDVNGVKALEAVGVASAVNYLTAKNAIAGGVVELAAAGTDANIPLQLSPKGTALVYMPVGYTANIGSDRETIITKGYLDDSLQANADSLLRRVSISSGWDSTMNIGNPTPNLAGRTVYISKVTLNVASPVTGGATAAARVLAGANEIMSFDENDITEVGTYISDLPFTFGSNNTQLTIVFYQADEITTAIPTGGNIQISVEYKIF